MANKNLIGTDRDLHARSPLIKSSSSPLGRYGVLLGIQDNGEPFYFDPWMLKTMGLIEFLSFLVLGIPGTGKSTLTKLISLRTSPRAHFSQHRTIRIGAINLKRTKGHPEYEALALELGSKVVSLRDAKLNILDRLVGLSLSEHLTNLVMVVKQIRQDSYPGRGGWITPIETKVLKAALEVWFGKGTPRCPELEKNELMPEIEAWIDVIPADNDLGMSFTITADVIDEKGATDIVFDPAVGTEVKNQDQTIRVSWTSNKGVERREKIEIKRTGLNLADLLRVLNDPKQLAPKIPSGETMRSHGEQISEAAAELTALLDQLYGGIYDWICGGDNSIVGDMSQRAVVLDFWGLDNSQVSLVQSLLWSYRASAARRGDDRFRVELSTDDENHELWKNPVYASHMALAIAVIREYGGCLFMDTHQLGDYVASGSKDAVNMVDKVAGLFIGKSTPKNARELQERYGFSNKTRDRLPNLVKGEFCFLVPGMPEVFFRTVLATDKERRICYSDGGHHDITGHETT